jgi:Ni/Co efflux regulator RcnB
MKRFAIAAAAALTLVGPLAAAPAFADPPRHNSGQYERRDNDQRDNRAQQQRWDNRRFNGYTYNGRWYYGEPSRAHASRAQFGWHNWRRGERLPSGYHQRYRQIDYRREHLRAPPRGYHYVRDDRGDVLMVAIATGLIASVILANN